MESVLREPDNQPDLPDYPESLKRAEALAMVLEYLVNDPIECLDNYSKSSEQLNSFAQALIPAIKASAHIMDSMVTNCLERHDKKIRERIAREQNQ